MKKIIAIAVFVVIAGSVSAQITITKNDMPSAGDSFTYYNVQAIGAKIDVSYTGTGYQWDFSNLKKTDSTMVKYERSAKTPYAFYFINTMGQKIADNLGFGQFSFTDVYSFYKTANTEFTAEGIGFKFSGLPLGGFYSDKDVIYHFPLTYGKHDSCNFKVSIQLPGIGTFKESGKRVNDVDGWGTIKLPDGVSYECIRIKSVINQIDSISVTQPFPIAFGFPSARVEYKWFTNYDRVPVLQITGTELLGNFTPTTIQYRPQSNLNRAGVKEVGKPEVKIYPNPAATTITVNIAPDVNTAVKLFDMSGREITVKANNTANWIEVDVQNIATGFYMLFVKSGNDVIWEKVEISR